MPSMNRFCPKCGTQLTVPQPAPEKAMCPKCGAVLRFKSHPKDGGQHAGQAAGVQQAPALVHAPAGPAIIGAAGTVAGHELRRELARGGLGVVYLGYHTHLEDYRAIKRPQARDGVDRDMLLARFRREVQSMGGISSQHVIRAFDAGVDADGPYLVMEYLDGESLSGLVARHSLLPVPEACEIIRQAALGLQAAHERGLIHRDIKPSNLMLARAGASGARVVVIDWGLVRRTGEAEARTARLTQLGAEMGTPDYLAPEQIRDARTSDIRADIYSLGVTLYFLLAGRPPFFDRTDEQKLHGQVRDEFPPLEQTRPNVPKKLLAVLAKIVNKAANERYQTPGEVADALQPFCCAGSQPLLALLPPAAVEQATPPPVLKMEDVLVAGNKRTLPSTPVAGNRGLHDGLLNMPTQLGSTPLPPMPTNPAAHTAPPRSRWWLAGLVAAAACFLLVGGVVALVVREEVWKPKGTDAQTNAKDKVKQPPPPTGPVLVGGEPGLLHKISGHPNADNMASAISFMPDGRTGVSRWYGNIHIWDLTDYIQRPKPWVTGAGGRGLMIVSPDGKRIAASTSNAIELFNGKTYKKEGPPVGLYGDCTALTFSPDSKLLATAEKVDQKGRIRFWDAEERDQRKTIELEAPVISLSFSLDGQFLAISDGSLASMNILNSGDKKIYVYRVDDGKLVRQLDGHPKAAAWVAFFADGKRLFSASPYDGTLRVWNVDEADKENVGKEIKEIKAGSSGTNLTNVTEAKDPNFITCGAFWPWGRALTAHLDGGLVLWDMDTGDRLLRFKNPSDKDHSHATAVAISPDGHHALAAYNDANVYLFRLPPPRDK